MPLNQTSKTEKFKIHKTSKAKDSPKTIFQNYSLI